jgi:hypothetical protein
MRITPKAIKFYHDDLEDFIQLYQEQYGKTFVTFWQDNGTIFIKQFDNLDDACLWCINESDKHIRAKK